MSIESLMFKPVFVGGTPMSTSVQCRKGPTKQIFHSMIDRLCSIFCIVPFCSSRPTKIMRRAAYADRGAVLWCAFCASACGNLTLAASVLALLVSLVGERYVASCPAFEARVLIAWVGLQLALHVWTGFLSLRIYWTTFPVPQSVRTFTFFFQGCWLLGTVAVLYISPACATEFTLVLAVVSIGSGVVLCSCLFEAVAGGDVGAQLRSPPPPLLVPPASVPVSALVRWVPATPNDESSSHECPICLEPLSPGQATWQLSQCRHLFHEACLQQCIQRTCPICRNPYVLPRKTEV